MGTPIIEGMRVYYNFTKNMVFDYADSAGVYQFRDDGMNKWKTIIQNASLHKENLI